MADHFDSELERMEAWIGGLMAGFDTRSRTQTAGKIARLVRGRHAKRIASQVAPDGTPFEPRKPQKVRAARNTTKKFLYPEGGSGKHRVVLMKSWKRTGPLYTGYDVEAGGIRSFHKDRIFKWLEPTPQERNKAAPRARHRTTIKQRAMFRKLRTYAYLRANWDASGVAVGYTGRSARIARIHQTGGTDRAARKAPAIRYARRQLLGLSPDDETAIIELLAEMAQSGI